MRPSNQVFLGEGNWYYNAKTSYLPSDAIKIGLLYDEGTEMPLNMNALEMCKGKKIRLIAEIIE